MHHTVTAPRATVDNQTLQSCCKTAKQYSRCDILVNCHVFVLYEEMSNVKSFVSSTDRRLISNYSCTAQQIKLDYICLSSLSSFISKNDDEILEIAFQIVRNSKNTYLPKLGSTFHCS